MSHTTLYRMFDAAGRLLYVGISSDPGQRMKKHAKSKDWWSEVASMSLEHFDARRDAEEAERIAIEEERPAYNVIYNRGNVVGLRQRDSRFVDLTEGIDAGRLRAMCQAMFGTSRETPHGKIMGNVAMAAEMPDHCRRCRDAKGDSDDYWGGDAWIVYPVAVDLSDGRALYVCHDCGARWSCWWGADVIAGTSSW